MTALMWIEIALLSIVACCLLFQLFYYWVYLAQPYYLFVRKKTPKPETAHQPSVSIVMYAKNEAENLETFLPLFLEQDYPDYELIVVDDDSTDDTEHVLKRMSLTYPQLYHTYLPGQSKNISRKKLALTLGVKAAKYDQILFVEADSRPVNNYWLRMMSQYFSDRQQILLGMSVLVKYPFRFAAYDYFSSNLQMAALALAGHPYMGNGRNLGYNKQLFFRQKGFSTYNFMDAGEDDLLVAETVDKRNSVAVVSPDSLMLVDMEAGWMWKEYKRRRSIATPFYKKFPRFVNGTEQITRLVVIAGTIGWAVRAVLLSDFILLLVASSGFLIREASQIAVINLTAKKLNVKPFLWMLPVYDLIQPFVNFYFYMYGWLSSNKDNHWIYGKKQRCI